MQAVLIGRKGLGVFSEFLRDIVGCTLHSCISDFSCQARRYRSLDVVGLAILEELRQFVVS